MKIIEAMKKNKDLARKAEDLRSKVSAYCADLDVESPTYQDQAGEIRGWIQAHTDIVQEICRLRVAIARTNLATQVKIDLPGTGVVEKSIAEWIHRRRDLSQLDLSMWNNLSDRGLKGGMFKKSSGDPVEGKVRRCFDPKQRDEMRARYMSEPTIIDGALEVVNAVTDLVV